MYSITRRGLIQGAAFFSAGLIARRQTFPALASPAPLTLDPNTLARYVDPLPIPEAAQPIGFRAHPEDAAGKLPYYRLAMREIKSKLHRDLPPARVWGFGASAPGPTFDTRSGEGLLVEWANELPPGKHFLPIDHTLHGAEPGLPEVRSVIHLHGGRTPASSDGYPEDWCVPGNSLTCYYPNRQPACMLFYHDHAMGINRLNIYAGMMGLFFVRDAYEDSLSLPRRQYEVPLLVYDRLLSPDGQLYYPVSDKPDAPWVPEVFGNAMLVNGKLFPYLDVEPRSYRLRLMNGSNGRFFRFSFGKRSDGSMAPGLDFVEIGTEQGFLPLPVSVKRVTMAPGERVDLLFDFSGYAGEKLLLRSDTFEIMEFRVHPKPAGAASRNRQPQAVPAVVKSSPSTTAPFVKLSENQAIRTRQLTLDERVDLVQRSMGMLLNNTAWHMPVTENPIIGTTEIWEFINLTDDSHPIHLHLVRFQILDRRPFDTFEYQDKGTVRFTGPALPPDATEAGWKDTVRADPGLITRIIIPFIGFTGRYVWHCHILEHEDNEMMRPYEVIAAPK